MRGGDPPSSYGPPRPGAKSTGKVFKSYILLCQRHGRNFCLKHRKGRRGEGGGLRGGGVQGRGGPPTVVSHSNTSVEGSLGQANMQPVQHQAET